MAVSFFDQILTWLHLKPFAGTEKNWSVFVRPGVCGGWSGIYVLCISNQSLHWSLMIVIIESRGSLDITHSTFRITAHQESNVIVIFVIFNIQCCVYPPNLAVMAMRHLAKEMHDNQCHCWSLDHNLLFGYWGLHTKTIRRGFQVIPEFVICSPLMLLVTVMIMKRGRTFGRAFLKINESWGASQV